MQADLRKKIDGLTGLGLLSGSGVWAFPSLWAATGVPGWTTFGGVLHVVGESLEIMGALGMPLSWLSTYDGAKKLQDFGLLGKGLGAPVRGVQQGSRSWRTFREYRKELKRAD